MFRACRILTASKTGGKASLCAGLAEDKVGVKLLPVACILGMKGLAANCVSIKDCEGCIGSCFDSSAGFYGSVNGPG